MIWIWYVYWYVIVHDMFLFAQVAAWRFGIDAKGRGQLNFNEFCTAVRRALPAPSWSYRHVLNASVDQRDTFFDISTFEFYADNHYVHILYGILRYSTYQNIPRQCNVICFAAYI